VANGADINLRDTDGDTPLLLCEEPEILDKILQLGANIADVNYSGESLFEKAVEDENDLLIQKLVDIGVISNEQATQALDTINGNVDPMEQYKIDEDEDMEASNP
jgi:ankyrin repeat protein